MVNIKPQEHSQHGYGVSPKEDFYEQSKKTILDAKQKLLGVTKQDREVRIPEDKTVEER